MKKKNFLFFLIFIFNCCYQITSANIYIYAYVDDEIITSHDIKKEEEYLKILNPNLNQLNALKISVLSKNSLINEIVKKKELLKFIDIEKENLFINDYLSNLYSKLKYSNEDEFKKELKIKGTYSLDQIKQKIKIELLWNELIYTRYGKQIKIDKEMLINKIKDYENKEQKEYLLSEIVFKKNKEQSLKNLINQIKLSIGEIGFDNTANIYSISQSSKLGGKLGWINVNGLSKLIAEKLSNLSPGEFTEVIQLGNSYVLLKINEVRINKVKIDKEKELEKLIQIETNKQLNQFSRIYFDKSKMNYSINEK